MKNIVTIIILFLFCNRTFSQDAIKSLKVKSESVAFSSNGEYYASVEWNKITLFYRGINKVSRVITVPNIYRINHIVFLPNNTHVAITGFEKYDVLNSLLKPSKIVIMDIETKMVVSEFPSAHQASITDLDISYNGKMLCTSSIDNKVKIWNIEDSRVMKEYDFKDDALCISFHPNNEFISIMFHLFKFL